MGYVGGANDIGEQLWRDYSVRREAIRACFERWFDRMEAGLKPSPAPVSAGEERIHRGEE
jgi:hypothetical protein